MGEDDLLVAGSEALREWDRQGRCGLVHQKDTRDSGWEVEKHQGHVIQSLPCGQSAHRMDEVQADELQVQAAGSADSSQGPSEQIMTLCGLLIGVFIFLHSRIYSSSD